ncbi:hypothetical protein OG361_01050 [Streptomyces sp. NBC_00090]|uniref:hypothetical protein n=1 Tax=Streptomyces sp. NBC_00090 TaxID=2903619 RepID=UPI003246962A
MTRHGAAARLGEPTAGKTPDTNGTFRFHQLRPGEQWHHEDLDRHGDDMFMVIEDRPRPTKAPSRLL